MDLEGRAMGVVTSLNFPVYTRAYHLTFNTFIDDACALLIYQGKNDFATQPVRALLLKMFQKRDLSNFSPIHPKIENALGHPEG